MRRVLPVLLSLCFLVEVTKGGVVLCRHSPKSDTRRQANLHYTSNTAPNGAVRKDGDDDYFYDDLYRKESNYDKRSNAGALRKDGDDDYFYDDLYRKESVRNSRLRAMLMKDSDDSNYRAHNKRNNYSALEGSLRADTLRAYANKDDDGYNRRMNKYKEA